jgi:hypothetical protein
MSIPDEHKLAFLTSHLYDEDVFEMPEELENERLEICNGCEYKEVRSYMDPHINIDDDKLEVISAEWEEVHMPFCNLCGCNLVSKTEQWTERCPIGKWELSYDIWKKYVLSRVNELVEQHGGEYDPSRWADADTNALRDSLNNS